MVAPDEAAAIAAAACGAGDEGIAVGCGAVGRSTVSV